MILEQKYNEKMHHLSKLNDYPGYRYDYLSIMSRSLVKTSRNDA
jgi:hypothetical protein